MSKVFLHGQEVKETVILEFREEGGLLWEKE